MMDIENKNIVVNRKALNLLLLKEGLGFFKINYFQSCLKNMLSQVGKKSFPLSTHIKYTI